ncbi:MAG: PKD domain-containing protein [Rivularia sp. (in: Bacteria)]|nr:PKD domain-containing protein [Rivularia sp. MS3]
MQILGSNYDFAANVAPIVTPTTVLTHNDLETFIELDTIATDPEGDPIYFRLADSSNGNVSFTPDGKFVRFTPEDGYFGDASFNLIADDGYSTAAPVEIKVDVSNAPLINLDIVNRSPRLDAGESTELVVVGDFSDQEDVILPASYVRFGSESGLVADVNEYGVLSGLSDRVEIVTVRKNGISAVTAVRMGDIPAPSNDSEFYVALAEQDGLQLYPEAVTLTTNMTRQLLVGLDESFSPELSTAEATDTFTYTVKDNDNNTSNTATVNITIKNSAPSIDKIDIEPNLAEGIAATFSADATDEGEIIYTWNFGDNTPELNGQSVTHTFADNGTYTATLTVTDSQGASTVETITLNVNNIAPTVTAGENQTTIENQGVQFNGNYSDP